MKEDKKTDTCKCPWFYRFVDVSTCCNRCGKWKA